MPDPQVRFAQIKLILDALVAGRDWDRMREVHSEPNFGWDTVAQLCSVTIRPTGPSGQAFPLIERVSLELTFGGSLHDGPNAGEGSAFGCPLNFRESASIGIAVTERWRLYGTIAHMSNAGLCARNSGLTSAGVRLGYALD